MLVHGNKDNFDSLVSDGVVVVDFFANWCGPCKMLGPVLEELSSSRSEVKVVKVDVENNLIAIKGAIPGPKGGIVVIADAVKA